MIIEVYLKERYEFHIHEYELLFVSKEKERPTILLNKRELFFFILFK